MFVLDAVDVSNLYQKVFQQKGPKIGMYCKFNTMLSLYQINFDKGCWVLI